MMLGRVHLSHKPLRAFLAELHSSKARASKAVTQGHPSQPFPGPCIKKNQKQPTNPMQEEERKQFARNYSPLLPNQGI